MSLSAEKELLFSCGIMVGDYFEKEELKTFFSSRFSIKVSIVRYYSQL